jgi:hypothetical protein
MIDSYLRELDASLDVPRRLRARIIHETRDHLLELVDSGLDEEEAVRSFGAPDALAREFHKQLAGASAHRSSALTGVMLLALAALAVVTPASWGFAAVAFVAGQVALVAGALALVRSLRYRAEGAVPASALPDIYRANAVTLACVVAIVIAFAMGLAAKASPSLIAATAALGVVALAAAVALVRSLARARPLAGPEPEGDAYDDLIALVPAALRGRARPAVNWIRRHPLWFCALFSAACGLAVGVGHIVTDGGFSGNVLRAAGAILLLAAIEGSAVVLGYVALGRVLGIRRTRARVT